MRAAACLLMAWFTAVPAIAAGPEYTEDPFGDADFRDAPLIVGVAHPTRGRGELSLLFSSSVIDKYTTHLGGMLQLDVHFTDTLGAALAVGFSHGTLTSIVTGDAGIIGNKVTKCLSNPEECDINPDVPDFSQITGTVQALAVWSPLYGKINVVSEIDVNLQAYVLLGIGANGTRTISAELESAAAQPSDYTLDGDAFFEGGFLSDPKVHLAPGVGLQVFVADWLALRVEARGLLFLDEFDFGNGNETYVSQFWFFQGGLGFILF